MNRKKIAVVMGGYSGEFMVSMGSGQIVLDNLDPKLFEAYKVVIHRDGWYVEIDGVKTPISREDFSVLFSDGRKLNFDAAFVAVHGSPAEDGILPAYFDLLGLPHTTSGHFPSALTFNKAECNMVLRNMNIRVPDSIFIAEGESIDADEIVKTLGLPLFVKPNCSGSSLGVSKVKKKEELKYAMEAAFAEGNQVVVEAAIIGREAACGVINVRGKVEALAITEIIPKNEFFDYESKYSGLSQEITPGAFSDSVTDFIKQQSELIFKKLNLSGIARVDYIVDEKDQPFLIEVNTVPGLSSESILPKQAAYLGMPLSSLFGEAINRLFAAQ
ncbi:MAG: D-alanine--D-alanine ligase [Cryomorphaceae bacterium]|nr:D-alanine--D-alanine ligase [Cryomorphaceae bacterium]